MKQEGILPRTLEFFWSSRSPIKNNCPLCDLSLVPSCCNQQIKISLLWMLVKRPSCYFKNIFSNNYKKPFQHFTNLFLCILNTTIKRSWLKNYYAPKLKFRLLIFFLAWSLAIHVWIWCIWSHHRNTTTCNNHYSILSTINRQTSFSYNIDATPWTGRILMLIIIIIMH